MNKLHAKAYALGLKDATRALDSGDYDYHRTTKGLSVVTLRDDMWSFREEALGEEGAAAWKQGWKEGIAGPAKPTFDAVLATIKETGRLDFNQLPDAREVPKEFVGLKTVKSLAIRMHKLAHFERLFTMPNVEFAYLSKLGIKAVPSEIRGWKKLKNLSLSENPLINIDAVCELTSLETLDLGHRMTKLPDAIGQLTNLKELDLFQAKSTLSELPASFANLKKLRVVRLPLDGAELKKQLKKMLPKVKAT